MSSDTIQWWSRWSDILAISGLFLGAFLAAITIAGWVFSWKAGKLKDEALELFKISSERAISEADAKAATANEIAARAHERAASLEKEANQAKLELAKLQARVLPRSISVQQSRAFTEKLAGEQKAGIGIWFNSNDNEAHEFAKQLRDLLLNAGYEPKEPNGLMTLGKSPMPRGVRVIGDENVAPILVRPLADALMEIGIDTTTKIVEAEEGKYHFSIEVGSKPVDSSNIAQSGKGG